MKSHMTSQSAPPPLPNRIPNLIAIASGKGGVGKTWAAATLAQALSFAGRRILLIDGDLGLANIDVQLGLEPAGDLIDAIAGRRSFADAVTCAAGGAGVRGGFDVLAGRSGTAALHQLMPPELRRFMRGIAAIGEFYDLALLDLGAGIDDMILEFCKSAQSVLVVLTDEPTSLTDAYALVKRMAQAGRPDGIRIVVNMAQDQSEGRKTAGALIRASQEFLNVQLSVAGVVRRDPKVREAIRRQQPFLSRHPQSPAATDLVAVANGLIASLSGAALPAPAPVKLAVGMR
jgi:flagellar biosynthesis protein FlhG